MKTHILTARIDHEIGELGYILDEMKQIQYPMVATEGFLIAHDLLEHVNGIEAIGSVDDEIQAMAGVWFIRGQFGDMSRNGSGSMYSAEENIATDILNLGVIYNNGVEFRTPVPTTKSHYLDDVFNCIIDIAKNGIKAEIDQDDRNQQRLDYYFDACLHYLRSAYHKLEKRFKDYDASYINSLFWNIGQALDPYMDPEYEGQQLILKYEISTCNVWVDEYYPDDEEWY